jgi:hypothetical protein
MTGRLINNNGEGYERKHERLSQMERDTLLEGLA